MCTAPDEDHGSRAKTAVKEEERRLRVGDGAALREFVAEPATGFRRGAVLIIHDIWGYTDFYKDLTRRITAQGHAAALVDFFGRQGDLPEAMREAVVTQQRAPKMDAPTGKLAGARQKTTNARIVSVPSVRPPR